MNRRTLLSGIPPALAVSIAGCLGGTRPPTAGNGTPTPEPGDSDGAAGGGGGGGSGSPHPRVTETTLTSTGQCSDTGTASTRVEDGTVIVTGCALGPNGCAVPVLSEVSYAPDGDLLTVVVASQVDRDEDEACTEALLPLGYEARVAMDGAVPGAVRVVHDDVDGRREVARTDRDRA